METVTLRLNDLLRTVGLEPKDCTILEHKTSDARKNRQLLRMAETDRAVFEFFQSTHSDNEGRALGNRSYTLSFVRLEKVGEGNQAQMILVGVYKVEAPLSRPNSLLKQDERYKSLVEKYNVPFGFPRDPMPYFELTPCPELSDLSGRLVVESGGWRRLVVKAEKYDLPIIEIKRTKQFDPPIDNWREYTLSASEVSTVGPRPRQQLCGWTGIYLITDTADGARYVGAAYGDKSDGLYGRWSSHVKGEKGITKWLDARSPQTFRFSILERCLDASISDITALEQTWITRLGTRHSDGWRGLNN